MLNVYYPLPIFVLTPSNLKVNYCRHLKVAKIIERIAQFSVCKAKIPLSKKSTDHITSTFKIPG